MQSEDLWDVTISRNGESLLTISHNCQSGKMNMTAEEEQVLYTARDHLDSFLGGSPSAPLTEVRDRGRGWLYTTHERETTEQLLLRYQMIHARGQKNGYATLAVTCALHLHCL